jgi:hypothetical protein
LLFKTIVAFRDLVNDREADGVWKAEFHGSLDVAAEGRTLEQCRSRALDELDEKLSAWIVEGAYPATPKTDEQ